MYSFSSKSLYKLKNVHPKLIALVFLMARKMDLTILEGERTLERQKELYKKGASTTLNSKHIIKDGELFCRAVDIAPYPINWNDIDRFKEMGVLAKECAKELDIDIVHGGDWISFKDYPHFQLDNNEK